MHYNAIITEQVECNILTTKIPQIVDKFLVAYFSKTQSLGIHAQEMRRICNANSVFIQYPHRHHFFLAHQIKLIRYCKMSYHLQETHGSREQQYRRTLLS